MVLICPSDKGDFRMRMFNPDGTEGEMCGNALRSVGKYVYDHKLTDKTKLVSSLEKVGISAQQATQWIERLTDPDNIEKNIGLYAQLGISISDALSGNIDGDTIG